jgi:hypothetical protein
VHRLCLTREPHLWQTGRQAAGKKKNEPSAAVWLKLLTPVQGMEFREMKLWGNAPLFTEGRIKKRPTVEVGLFKILKNDFLIVLPGI